MSGFVGEPESVKDILQAVERPLLIWQLVRLRKLFSDARMRPEEIDLLLVSTMSSERIMPCAACEVQKLIGAVNAACFDLNGACTGFLLALNTAQAYLGQQIYRRALVIGSETLSHLTNWKDRSTCVLFGDGAGAVVLEAEENAVYIQAAHSIGSKGEALTCVSRNQQQFIEKDADLSSTYMQMDGKEVFKFAVSKVPEVITEVLEKAGKTKEEIRFYMLHQANKRIVASVSKHMNEPLEKVSDEYRKSGEIHPPQAFRFL